MTAAVVPLDALWGSCEQRTGRIPRDVMELSLSQTISTLLLDIDRGAGGHVRAGHRQRVDRWPASSTSRHHPGCRVYVSPARRPCRADCAAACCPRRLAQRGRHALVDVAPTPRSSSATGLCWHAIDHRTTSRARRSETGRGGSGRDRAVRSAGRAGAALQGDRLRAVVDEPASPGTGTGRHRHLRLGYNRGAGEMYLAG